MSFFELNLKKKRIFYISKLILVLSFVLAILYVPYKPKVEASSSFSFPKLGSSSLKDPEGYEKATLITTLGIALTGNNAARTEVLDKSYYGFSLSGDFSDVTIKVKKSNGTYTDLLKAEGEDSFYGNDTSFDTSNENTSALYAFSEGISEIEFYYSGTKNFSINKYEFAPTAATAITPTEYASTAAETNYKEKLFSEMGFNLITREEWGAPTQSPWNPNVAHVNRVVVHHTATSVDMANPKNTVMAVYNFHYYRCANNSGSYNASSPDPNCDEPSEWWTDVGYNYLIDPYGNIYEGRSGGNGVVGAHAIPNTGSIGISILGNYVSQQATQASMEALTRLISAVTQLNDFDAVWHGGDPASGTGLYGHKDLAATACPATIYDSLPTVASLAMQMKPSNAKLKEVNQESHDLTTSREYLIEGTSAQLILDSTGLSSVVKEKLLTESRGVTDVKEVGNTIIYEAKNTLINQLIAETLLVAPTTKIQPNFIYRLDSWDNTDSNRSIPSDYDTTTHWNLEKIKAPEAWKDLGGCTSDSSCGGSQSTVVAVLDTGLAYENFGYDAGDDDTYTSEKFSGLFIEYPTSATQDGTFVNGSFAGYEREFNQSSEMNGVNIVSPYDAVQDYFCTLRTLDGNSANNCNANETAKIDHPNDDYGHGTFVTTIIAGKTSDSAPNKVVGIGHNLSIMPIKVFYPTDKSMCQDSAGNLDLTCSYSPRDYRAVGDSYVITQAINYAVANGADVINMSLRGPGSDPLMQTAITNAVNNGVVVVAAAGNDNANVSNYFPAGFSNVITVGATNSSNVRASYSNFGSQLDLVTPVGDSGPKIASQTYLCFSSITNCSDETNSNLFNSFSSNTSPTTGTGTSFAAPQVSAAAGLLKSVDPTLSTQEIYFLLTSAADDLGTSGFDNDFGYGQLNLEKSIGIASSLSTTYFSWYDATNIGATGWIMVGNPSPTDPVNVNIKIGNYIVNQNFTVPAGGKISPKFLGSIGGPVSIVSDGPIFASQRALVNNSFNEYAGISETSLDTKFYYPWYDSNNVGAAGWILVGNPSSSTAANVNIKIGVSIDQNYSVSPGTVIAPKFQGTIDGPVIVTSNIPVFSTQRALYKNSFSEYSGIGNTNLSNKYYFPWYDSQNAGAQAWILVGNPSSTTTANVNIKVGTSVDQNYSIPPGGLIKPKYSGTIGGPVVVSSNINVYAAQRALVGDSFNEYKGISDSSLTTIYNYTWYDSYNAGASAWILVGNPSPSVTANVNIKIGTSIDQNFTIPPNGRITPKFVGTINGPVKVSSNIPVYTTEREVYNGFAEYPGIPQ